MEVREGGLEPPRPEGHRHLKPARLPIPPLARVNFEERSAFRLRLLPIYSYRTDLR